MAKIFLFGSYDIFGVPQEVINWLDAYNKQGHEFIVGDSKGADASFHKALSSVGANKVTIYGMDYVQNNSYDFPTKIFVTEYDEESKEVTIKATDDSVEPKVIEGVQKAMDIPHTREWYEFKDRLMISECDIAICLYDGSTKSTMHNIQLMNMMGKNCYTFTIQV